jgi:polyphosphate kinase 2 (PPK2 family)
MNHQVYTHHLRDLQLLKYWLDISKDEQARRLDVRRTDPLKALKVSDLDGLAQKNGRRIRPPATRC